MKKMRLTKKEKEIHAALLKGEFADVPSAEFSEIARALAARKKDAVLNLRINSADLENLKRKARKLGVKYQTFIAEILHRVAQN